jgi:tetratricopeptide (TPR) repeat protein
MHSKGSPLSRLFTLGDGARIRSARRGKKLSGKVPIYSSRTWRHQSFRLLVIILFLVFELTATVSAWQVGESEDAQLRRIQQLIQSGDLQTARTQLQQTLANLPNDARLYNLLGVVDAQERNFAGAESNFLRAIQIAPRFTGAYLNLGRLYQEHVDVDPNARRKALDLYQKLLEFQPTHVEATYEAARLSNSLGAFAVSQRYLDRLPAAAQERPQALALRCANLAAAGKVKEAETSAQRLLTLGDLTEDDVLPLATTLMARHADDLATQILEGIVHRGLASGKGLQQLAGLYEAHFRYKEARETLEKAVPMDPPSVTILLRLAQLAYQSGDREGALGYLAHASDLEPGNAAVRFFFGMVCVELNLPQEARKSLEEAVRLEPSNAYYNYALGAVLVQVNNPDGAVPYFQKYCALRAGDVRGRFALAVAYFYTRQLESARRELQSIADRPETRMGAQLFLGRTAIEEGNLAEALEHLQLAIKANPSTPEAYAELGLVYIRRKEYALAEKTLSRALELAPDDYLSNLRLLMLYQRTKDSRTEPQTQRVDQIRKSGQEREQLLMRTLEIRPY